MAEITEERLKRQLSTDMLDGLYVLAGEEKYLVKRAAARLQKKAGGDSFPEFNSQEFGNDDGIDAIADGVEALPFFAERKCVLVSDFNVEEKSGTELAKLAELLDNLPKTTVLIFAYPTLETDWSRPSKKWGDFLKKAREKGSVLFCQRRSLSDLQDMLVQRAKRLGCALSRRDAGRMVETAGQDVALLQNELEKLTAYALGAAPEGVEPEITPAMIEEMVPQTTETKIYKLSDALVAGNYEQAYRMLDNLFYQKVEPVVILGTLSSAYVDLARVKTALESGLTAEGAGAYGDYKRKEFRLRNAQRSARRMTPQVLGASLDLLLAADGALKGSRLDPRVVLEELIAKLLLAARGETP